MYILPAISCFYPRAAVEDIVGSLDSAVGLAAMWSCTVAVWLLKLCSAYKI